MIVTARQLGRPTLLVRAVDGILGTHTADLAAEHRVLVRSTKSSASLDTWRWVSIIRQPSRQRTTR